MQKGVVLEGSVLASVLVMSTLVLLGVLAVISFRNMELLEKSGFHYREQQRADVESGFLLYSVDSTFLDDMDRDSIVQLYPDEEGSGLKVRCVRWGMYEVVSIAAGRGRHESVRLMGKRYAERRKAAFYMPDEGRFLSLAGKVKLEGRVYVPARGMNYSQAGADFFSGRKVETGNIFRSGDELPGIEPETREYVERLFEAAGSGVETQGPLTRPFGGVPLCLEVDGRVEHVEWSGHLLIRCRERLFISRNSRLENVVVVAPAVEVEEGFRGSVQIFATDSVRLGNDVVLREGSGLYLRGGGTERGIYLGERCELNGYVIVEKGAGERSTVGADYVQPESCCVMGLVYVDGIAEVHGIVAGSLYVGQSYYFTPEGYYSSVVYHLALLQDSLAVYPLGMEGPYERRVVKWLE